MLLNSSRSAAEATLDFLEQNLFIDTSTRVLFIDFSVYNAQVYNYKI